MTSLDQQIKQAITLIQQANRVVALTGAGISTPSGIPDFRSPKSSLWQQTDPLSVASIYAFRQNPQAFYDWVHPLAETFLAAQPNPAHHALVELEKMGKMKAVITQNIDNLHYKAGSQTILELHGHLREFTCLQCYKAHSADPIIDNFLETGKVPQCDCPQHGVLKPNIILFGEQLPMREFVAAQMAIEDADLVLVAGSSLEVAPVSDLPHLALKKGAKVIIVNYRKTYLDEKADLVIQADVAEVLPRLAKVINQA